MKKTIYIIYSDEEPTIKSDIICPIQAGRAISEAPLWGMSGDDTGENISEKYLEYSDLTVLYWIWKNDQTSDWLGFMNFSRLIDFTGDFLQDSERQSTLNEFDTRVWRSQTENWIERNLNNFDLITSESYLKASASTLNSDKLQSIATNNEIRDFISNRYPRYLKSLEKILENIGNPFELCGVMRRDLFHEFCDIIFGTLSHIEGCRDRHFNSKGIDHSRQVKILFKCIFQMFIDFQKNHRKDVLTLERNIICTEKSFVFPLMEDDQFNTPEHINLAFTSDLSYLMHTAAMLRSATDNLPAERRLNLFFLHDNLDCKSIDKLKEVVDGIPEVRFFAIRTNNFFDGSHSSPGRMPSNSTYNRFLIFLLFPGLNRILYVDADIVFRGDLGLIFDSDIGEAPLGAVTDHIMTRVLSGSTPTINAEATDLRDYYFNELQCSPDEMSKYFNAGFLLFNLSSIDTQPTARTLISLARNKRYIFRDQDILNIYFKNDVFILDSKLNAFNSFNKSYENIPKEHYMSAMSGRKRPRVVHYAARNCKPWLDTVPMGQYYWKAISRTPFYLEALNSLVQSERMKNSNPISKGILTRCGIWLAKAIPSCRPILWRIYRWLN